MLIVDADAIRRERRRTFFAYLGSFIAQIIAFILGWIVCANWPMILMKFN